MKKEPFKVQLDHDVQESLHALGGNYQLTGNQVLASAAAELARVHKAGGNLWHALGRIAADDGAPSLPTASVPRIPRGERALQAV